MLHTTTGFLCAATGFALIDILNRNSRIKFQLSPIYVALTAFCFSMTVGVLWEFSLSSAWTGCSSWICRRTPWYSPSPPSC